MIQALRSQRWRLSVVTGAVAILTTTVALAQSWSTQTVDGSGKAGYQNVLAFNPITGFPAIAYAATVLKNQDQVRYAEWNGATWVVKTVAVGDTVGAGISLAFDPAGNPGVVFGYKALKFARRSGSTWTTQTVDNQMVTSNSSLAYKNGEPWIAYCTNPRALRVARKVGSSWSIETVDPAGATYPSIAFASDGNPSIAYRFGTSTATLRFAHKSGSAWSIQNVETGPYYGIFASLAHDPLTGYPAIAHGISDVIRFVRWDGSQWVGEVAATGYSVGSESLAYDPAGVATLSYELAPDGNGSRQLRFARRSGCSGTCWDDQLVVDATPLQVEARTSLAFAPTGLASIAYGVTYPEKVKFAQQVP